MVEGHFDELLDAIYASDLEQLRLDDNDNIGYTFKALGAGFWALKQTSFRKAIEAVTMEVSVHMSAWVRLVLWRLVLEYKLV